MADGRKSRRRRVRSRGGVPVESEGAPAGASADAPPAPPADPPADPPASVSPPAETPSPAVPAAGAPPPAPKPGPAAKPPPRSGPPPKRSSTPPKGPVSRPSTASRQPPRAAGDDQDRGLRGLVGAGSSAVGVSGAMRARDAARPTDDDLATAERDLVIVRRNWTPPPGEQPIEKPRPRS